MTCVNFLAATSLFFITFSNMVFAENCIEFSQNKEQPRSFSLSINQIKFNDDASSIVSISCPHQNKNIGLQITIPNDWKSEPNKYKGKVFINSTGKPTDNLIALLSAFFKISGVDRVKDIYPLDVSSIRNNPKDIKNTTLRFKVENQNDSFYIVIDSQNNNLTFIESGNGNAPKFFLFWLESSY